VFSQTNYDNFITSNKHKLRTFPVFIRMFFSILLFLNELCVWVCKIPTKILYILRTLITVITHLKTKIL